MRLAIAFLLSIFWIGSVHAKDVIFYEQHPDKFWVVKGVARDSGQATCYGEANMKDGSYVEIHRSLVDGELWGAVHNILWEMNPTGGGTLRLNFYSGNNVNGGDFRYQVRDKNTILILALDEKSFAEVSRGASHFTLVMPDNLKNITFSFERTGGPLLAAITECVEQNAKNYQNPYKKQNEASGTDASAGDNIEAKLNVWEKRLIQEGLILLGYYNGFAEGSFGRGTREALTKFQADKKRPATGNLTAVDAATLGVTALQLQDKLGWRPLDNSKTGISMSYPAAWLTKRGSKSELGGETIEAPSGKLSLMTIQVPQAAPNGLDTLYRAVSERFNAQITYSLRRPGYFIVSGTGNGQTFYSRAEQRGNEIRGYDLIWRDDGDKENAQVFQNISVLTSSYFYPFGGDPAQGKPTYPVLAELIKIATKGGSADNGRSSNQSSGSGGNADNDEKGITEQSQGALPPPTDGSLVTSDGLGLRFVFRYMQPDNPDLQFAFKWAAKSHLFSSIPEIRLLDGTLVLPRQLNYVAAQCGAVNAFYAPKLSAVVLCYEMIASLEKMGKALSKGMSDPDAFVDEFVRDNVRFFLLHETGHALIDLAELPAVGREEDSVDQLATVLLLTKFGDDESKNAKARVLQLASTWFKVNSSQSSPDLAAFADEHSLDAQRYYNMLCIAYGLDKQQYGGLVSKGLLPQARAERCENEAAKIKRSWLTLILPHFAPRFAPKTASAGGASNDGGSSSPKEKNPLEWDKKSNPFGD